MYSRDGFATRPLCTALQMCVANYTTTHSCTEGSSSAPVRAPPGLEDAKQKQLQVLVAETWDFWSVFPFWLPNSLGRQQLPALLNITARGLLWLARWPLSVLNTSLQFSPFLDLTKAYDFMYYLFY